MECKALNMCILCSRKIQTILAISYLHTLNFKSIIEHVLSSGCTPSEFRPAPLLHHTSPFRIIFPSHSALGNLCRKTTSLNNVRINQSTDYIIIHSPHLFLKASVVKTASLKKEPKDNDGNNNSNNTDDRSLRIFEC